MGVFKFISALIDPATRLLDELLTSEEEKLQAKAVLLQIQTGFVSKIIDYESKLLDAQSSIIVAEVKSDSWLTKSWRPIVMISFAMIVVYSFVVGQEIPQPMWITINIGLGGYIGSRGLEKTIPAVVKVLKQKEES